jgi:stage IV sporulation protein FB
MIRFSLFRIPVEIQPFFWITLALIGGASRADTSGAMVQIALFVMAGFISVLVHELGHALTGRTFGAQTSITLQAFGGYAAFTGTRFTRPQSFLVTLAGPVIQMVLGLIILAVLTSGITLQPNAQYFLSRLMIISFVWALFNLLPILPLDGGQILNAILGPRRIKITLWTSIVAAVLCAFALYRLNPSWLIGPIFMGFFAWQSYQALREQSWR